LGIVTVASQVAASSGVVLRPTLPSTRGPAMTGEREPIEHGPAGRLGGLPPSLTLLAATAIAVVWGGILVIAQVEQLLAPELRWWGHAVVHVWTAAWATVIAVTAARVLRSGRASRQPLRLVVVTALLLAATAAVANLLEIVGAYPAYRAFHDAVNRVGAPVGWLLLANLVVIVVLGRREGGDRS